MSDKAKKTIKKKVAPKKEEPFPENPTRSYGACVRKMRVSRAAAAKLVRDFEFRVISAEGDFCTVIADWVANKKYEAKT